MTSNIKLAGLSLGQLSDVLNSWCIAQGVQPRCAREMSLDESLSAPQREWLTEFADAFEQAEDELGPDPLGDHHGRNV